MDLLIGHQPLKIILISFMFIMINGDVLRLQPVTLPTFTIPPNVSTSDLVAANKIKIIGNDIINNEIIEKKDKDIIHIQSILPKFNRTLYNKRKKFRNNNNNKNSESKIVNVGNFLQPKLTIKTTSQLPITIPKRSPQISQVFVLPDDQTESIIFHSLLTTPFPQKVGPYLYERPTGEPFEIENKFSYGQTEIPITKKPKYLYEKPTGNPFEIEDRFGQEEAEPPITATEPRYFYDTHTGEPSEIKPIISPNDLTEKPVLSSTVPDSKYYTQTTTPSKIKPTISPNNQTEKPVLSSTVPDSKINTQTTTPSKIKPTISPNNQTMLSSTVRDSKYDTQTSTTSKIEPIINQTEKPMLTDTKPAFVQISGGNGKFDIRTLRVLNPKKRKHRKKNRKNRKMDKNILENEIVKIPVN